MMKFYKVSLIFLLAGSLCLGISSCDTHPSEEGDRTRSSLPNSTAANSTIQPAASVPRATPTPTISPSSATPSLAARSQPLNAPTKTVAATTTAQTQNTVPVTIYKVDGQCQNLVPQKVTVSAQKSMEAAVSKTLAQWDTADFSLTGYRVSVDPDSRVATVDLRVSPSSKRQLESLSSCEQLALLGAVNKTLTTNPQWKIESVRFTEQGEEVVL
ncbi:hypothetical protein NDA01_10180 [Trichocoleus desertorum AS-A10]|uniref:sporulation/spore germination protein n=1 Tax=Trichocoleus desertorum TaxID=1481672 RepID=UPI00329A5BB3